MKFLSFFAIFLFGNVCLIGISAEGAASARARGEDKDADSSNDLLMGMSGLKEAASDPKLMAQLMQDLQVRTCRGIIHNVCSSEFPFDFLSEAHCVFPVSEILFFNSHDAFPSYTLTSLLAFDSTTYSL
jgi:hypothetical protein